MTQSPPTPTDVPEDRRTAWLLAFLILPIVVAPAAATAGAVVMGTDPFPWKTIGTVTLAAVVAAMYGGLIVMLVPRVAAWFGSPAMIDLPDERVRAMFAQSTVMLAIVSGISLIVAAAVTASLTPVVVLCLQTAAFYLTMLYLGRRT